MAARYGAASSRGAPSWATQLRRLAAAGVMLAALPLAGLPATAHAALFDDDEARRQINDLRARVDATQRVVNDRLEKLDAAVQDKKPLLDLAAMVEGLRSDIAKLRGQNEVLLNQSENLEKRQRDLYVDLDARLRKLEQAQAAIQDKLAAPERDAAKEKEAYDGALNQFRQNNFGAAITAFQGFMSSYSSSQLLPSAQYWIGNAYYAMRDYKSAIAAQQKVVATWPDNPKAADALLNIASSQAELGDAKGARESLQQLVKKYPGTPAAEQAKQRLSKR
ncbi:MAG TPA: tol-pal system protein YbgF [Burkholderiales bacterium]|nr:tol-pal system protein YbgF [Burkholderiales bacterium]